jgi:VanZ family protein
MGSGVKPHFLWLWGPVLAYMALIFYISSLHQAPLPPGVSDKGGHSFGYFGLGLLAVRALADGLPARVSLRTAGLALVIAIGYGATDELHQLFVPGRSADMYDLCADAAGSSLGVVACWAWGIISIRSRP